MKEKDRFISLVCISIILILVPLYALGQYYTYGSHPDDVADELGRKQMCTDCHDTDDGTIVYERYNHNVYFAENHGHQSRQNSRVCDMCHRQSFCNDCHVTRNELKPSLKMQTDNPRRFVHRGDYLSRHQIDGRINPIPCFRCHGNPRSSITCKRCHG